MGTVMDQEKLKQVYELLSVLPTYVKQLRQMSEKFTQMYNELQKEFNSHPIACPFCKQKPYVVNTETDYFPFRCHCSNAACENQLSFAGSTKEEAVGRWNFFAINTPEDVTNKEEPQ